VNNEIKDILSIIAALPRPEDDAMVKECATKRAAILAHVEDLVEQASVAAAGQHAAEQALAAAVTTGDKRHLDAAETQLDAALLQRQRFMARARALDAAAARLDVEEAAAWPGAVARARVAWDDAGASVSEAHAAALAALKAAENDIAVYGNALALVAHHRGGVSLVRFNEQAQIGGASYQFNEQAGFPIAQATDAVKRGVADFAGVDAWRQHLVLLMDPDLAARRAAARADRAAAKTAGTGPTPRLSGRGQTPSANPDAGAMDPTGLT
jgi:hypothetical protein